MQAVGLSGILKRPHLGIGGAIPDSVANPESIELNVENRFCRILYLDPRRD